MISYYRHILDDPLRIRAYRKAIKKAIRPGDTVLDLGCGLGTYALFAAQAGAKRVYAIDSEKIIYTAMEVARLNGYSSTIRFHRTDSEEYRPPHKVDWIVTEFFGASAADLLLTGTMADAMRRFLKPGGRVIPATVRLFIAPFECHGLYQREIVRPRRKVYGLDFSVTTRMAANTIMHRDVRKGRRLAQPALLGQARLPGDLPKELQSRMVFRCVRRGTIHGFAVWFDADLVEGVRLSTAPTSPPIAWHQLYLPLQRPIPVTPGHRVHLDLLAQGDPTGDIWWRWHGYRTPSENGRQEFPFRQSSFSSVPLPPHGTTWLRHGAPLTLSQTGEEMRYLLSRVNRQRTLEDLVRDLRAFLPARYRTDDEARFRIAELGDWLRTVD
jgi:precorrin-6B methylase 2